MSLQLDPETAAYVRSTPKLSPKRLAALLRAVDLGRRRLADAGARRRGEAAKREVVAGSIRLAVGILAAMDVGRVEPEDALSLATLAIYDALKEHDPDKGRFAPRLRHCIARRIEDAKADLPDWGSLDGLDFEAPPVERTDFEHRERLAAKVDSAVLALPEKRADYIARHYGINGPPRSVAEIASIAGVGERSVQIVLDRGRSDLRRSLADLDPAA